MTYPKLITALVLHACAATDETHAMRVEVKGCMSNVAYRLAGKRSHRYLLTYDPQSHAHILDVPASVWMKDNAWMARDLLEGPQSRNVIVLTVPWCDQPAQSPEPQDEPLSDADEVVKRALAILGI